MTATVPALSGLVGSGSDTVRVVVEGPTLYVGSPALTKVTGGSTWLKATLPSDPSSASDDAATLAMLADPSRLVGLLSSVGGSVTTVGDVQLHGTPTTEYSTTVTIAQLASRAGVGTGPGLGAQVSRVLARLGNASVPLHVWVGADGRVRQITASVKLSRVTLGGLASDLIGGAVAGALPTGSGGQATTTTSVTVGFSHYGAPVTVSVPPASEVTDVNAVVRSVTGLAEGVRHAVSALASKL